MPKKKQSKKHHYLPRKYLKGFTDSQNGFWIYDKQEDKYFKSSPNATFFEKNLNTVEFPNGKTADFLEDLYTHIENHSWEYFDRIKDSNAKTLINPLDKANLLFFLLFLHWRLPNNITFAENLSSKAFTDDETLNYFNLIYKNGEKAPQKMTEMIKNSSAFKKTIKLLTPFAPFHKDKNWSKNIENWRFLYTQDNQNWFIVGDNPIITKGTYDHDPIKCLNEFIFPVSGRILLVNISRPIQSGFPPDFILPYSTAIIERAVRFVACPNENFLKALVDRYKIYQQFNKTHTIISEVFELLEK
jgi:hypothetical protein